MEEKFDPVRYSIIHEKNPREIIMLRGKGCRWKRCRFCDYHLDFSLDEKANYILNKTVIENVTGVYSKLETINSGSYSDLDCNTLQLIKETAVVKQINTVHFECHWQDRAGIPGLRDFFGEAGIAVKLKIGAETFDPLFRESYLDKGMVGVSQEEIAKHFDEVCLLLGIPGQTLESMGRDISIGLELFERVCVNIMQENKKPIKPDPDVIKVFAREIYPIYKDDPRVDILMENTAFGVGGEKNNVQ